MKPAPTGDALLDMRLTANEIAAIIDCAARHFGANAVVRLFGSRVHDHLRGGDIDLHITTEDERTDVFGAKACFKDDLERRIGERRIDVLVSGPGGSLRPIEAIALRTGIILPDRATSPVATVTRQISGKDETSMPSAHHSAMLADALGSGEIATFRLRRVSSELLPDLPLTPHRIGSLTWDEQLRTDSLLLQFDNLVAIVQDQLIRGTLVAEGEPVAQLSRLDQRHVAEKIGALPNGLDLERIANARNAIAHRYPANADYQAAIINEVVTLTPMLIAAFEGLAEYVRRRGHVAC